MCHETHTSVLGVYIPQVAEWHVSSGWRMDNSGQQWVESHRIYTLSTSMLGWLFRVEAHYWSIPELVMQSQALYLMHQNNTIHDCFLLTMACPNWTMTQTVQKQLIQLIGDRE